MEQNLEWRIYSSIKKNTWSRCLKKGKDFAGLVASMKTTRDRKAAGGGKPLGGNDSSNILEDDEIMLLDTLCESKNKSRKIQL